MTRKALCTYAVASLMIVLPVILPFRVHARFYNTLYWMSSIPQSGHANPALFPQPKFYVGLPIISSAYFDAANRGFKLGDLLLLDLDERYYWDVDHLLGRLKRHNLSRAGAQMDLFSFGLRYKQNHFSFSVSEKADVRMAYSPDLLRLIARGSQYFMDSGGDADFSGLAADISHRREWSIAYARQWTPSFTTGLRAKLLQGLSVAWLEQGHMNLLPDEQSERMLVHTDLLMNTSVISYFFEDDADEYQVRIPGGHQNYLKNKANTGFGIDLGLTFKPIEPLTISVSALDIGFINWHDRIENYHITGASEFDGIELQDLFEGNIAENFYQMVDTTWLDLDITEAYNAHRQWLSPTFIASAAYDLSYRHQLAILGHGTYYNGSIYPSVSLSYHVRPSPVIGLALSYSVVHMNYVNVGFGMNLNLGPVQLYVVSDNVLAPIMPYQSQMVNFHAGLNLVFGYRPSSGRPMYSW